MRQRSIASALTASMLLSIAVIPTAASADVAYLAQLDGVDPGSKGEDWIDDSDPALSYEEKRDIQEQERKIRELRKRERYIQRLEDLGVGQGGGGGGSSSSGSSGGGDSSSDSGGSSGSSAASVGDAVAGAGKEVKPGTGGPGPLGEITKVPENAGVDAPNKVAWTAVQKGVALLTSGQTMTYGGVRPQPDTEKSGGVIDCSGLILLAYGEAGIAVGGIASGQKHPGNPVKPSTPGAPANPDTSKQFKKIASEKDALPGDIYIWGDGAGAGSHVSMVMAKDGDTVITIDYGGGNLIQKPGDGSADGRNFAGIFRPSLLEDGSPTIPEAES